MVRLLHSHENTILSTCSAPQRGRLLWKLILKSLCFYKALRYDELLVKPRTTPTENSHKIGSIRRIQSVEDLQQFLTKSLGQAGIGPLTTSKITEMTNPNPNAEFFLIQSNFPCWSQCEHVSSHHSPGLYFPYHVKQSKTTHLFRRPTKSQICLGQRWLDIASFPKNKT